MTVTVWPLLTLLPLCRCLLVFFCVGLLDLSGSVVLLIFIRFFRGLSDWRLWTAGNALWTFAVGE